MSADAPARRLLAGSLAALLLFVAQTPASAQGFAGLGAEAGGYLPVTRPAELSFPRDHGAHPGFRIEWWYLTANLTGPDGRELGVQWTLFRQALSPGPEAPGWDSNAAWMAHAAVTTSEAHHFAEAFARGGIGQAGVRAEPFEAWIDDWAIRGRDGDAGGGGDQLAAVSINARGGDFSYDLKARAPLPPVPQGENGYSVKSAGEQASYYYSQPFYEVSGTVRIGAETLPVTGTAWLDREWSSQPLAADQRGWDWFALSLASGARVMLFALRSDTGEPFLSGTWIGADGRPTPLASDEIRLTPEPGDGDGPPTRWRIEVPRFGLATTAEALNPAAWVGTLYRYWEGPIRLDGGATGRGYLEMTGGR